MLVYGKCECFVMHMVYVCVLCAAYVGSSLCCVLHDWQLMLVENERGDHVEEAYSRASLMTALLVAISISFCLPYLVAGVLLLFEVCVRVLRCCECVGCV